MLTTTRVITGRIRCSADVGDGRQRVLPEVDPVGVAAERRRQARRRSSRRAGRMFRPGPLKMKISMIPSQNVGMAKPT